MVDTKTQSFAETRLSLRSKLFGFQNIAHDWTLEKLLNYDPDTDRPLRIMLASPTGSGKSFVALTLQDSLNEHNFALDITTPRLEIVIDFCGKLGLPRPDTESQLERACEELGIYTPIRYRNRLMQNRRDLPDGLLIDECHHAGNVATYEEIEALIGPVPLIGLTATPYRGTFKGTIELLEKWGEPQWIIHLDEAIAQKRWNVPRFVTLPLVDDSVVTIKNGQFVDDGKRGIEGQVSFDPSKDDPQPLDRLAEYLSDRLYVSSKVPDVPNTYDLSTVISVGSSRVAQHVHNALQAWDLPCVILNAATPLQDRQRAFTDCEEKRTAIIHVNIVSEGNDLKLQRWVDLSSTLSPVNWMQKLGRISRFTNMEHEYLCCNQNLLRFSYLLEGIIPTEIIKKSQSEWGEKSLNRLAVTAGNRVANLTLSPKLKPVPIKLANGLTARMWSISSPPSKGVMQNPTIESQHDYVMLEDPRYEDPIWWSRINIIDDGGKKEYGKFARVDPEEVNIPEGCQSIRWKTVTSKQEEWWDRDAEKYGLDPEQDLNPKVFSLLPCLANSRIFIK